MMGLDSINSNSNVGGITPSINTDEAKKTSMFAGKKIGSTDIHKADMGKTIDVQQNALVNHAETGEVAKADNIQETSKPMGMFGKLKIGPGNASNNGMKNKIGGNSDANKNKSLESYTS
jgi:hypothetical protein